MRVLLHDYSGHPFQVQLSRALAASHDVLHVHCSSYRTGKGALTPLPDDPPRLRIEAIDLGESFDRLVLPALAGRSAARRLRQELAYGTAFTRLAATYRPDVVLSSNDPLFSKTVSARWCRRTGTPWVFWLQDVYSVAMSNYAGQRLGPAGRLAGGVFRAIERRLLREAAAVVAITDNFRPLLEKWRVPTDKCHVIENWASVEELDVRPKDNPWSRAQGLHESTVLLYSGTLGLKHEPGLLVALAERFRTDRSVRVVVVSEGSVIDWMAGEVGRLQLDNVLLLPYQPYDRLPEIFATADVLLTLLDNEAGVFSVPSKVLSYLCAGRPILASMPASNLGATTIARAGAGIVVEPGDTEGFVAGAAQLLGDESLRRSCGRNARAYAERTFDLDTVVGRFETILVAAAATSCAPHVDRAPQ